MGTLESLNQGKRFVTAESQATSKKTISKDKSNSCAPSTRKQKSSRISEVGSLSSEKACVPFWNPLCQEIASHLYLPIVTYLPVSDSISSGGLLSVAAGNSWFSKNLLFHQNRSSLQISCPSSMFFHAECTDLEITKTKLLRLSPTAEQKKTFKLWTDCSRYVFNQTMDYIRSCVNFSPSWYDIKKDLLKRLPEWCNEVPYQIRGIAIKEAREAFWKANGHPDFRRAKDLEQSCFIPKSSLKKDGIYYTISGKGLRYLETIPDNFLDSRLIWKFGKWWIAVPYKVLLSRSENQGTAAIVALDPGIRSFITFYSPDHSGSIGKGDFGRIQRLCTHLDNLISRRDRIFNKQKRRSYTQAAMRMRAKIKHLILELHHKTAKFLTDNFDVILLPTFETQGMVLRAARKIGKKSVRSMLTFAHYQFKRFLKWKAFQTGKIVLDCDEAYTSKTHPETGQIRNIGSAKRVRLLNGSWADRDVVGARNIMIRALSDSTMPIGMQLAFNNEG